MNRDIFACVSPLCGGRRWIVERVEETAELWQISAGPADPGFLVAASEPICPCCGESLCTIFELKGAAGYV